MPVKTELSDAAIALLRYRLANKDNRVTDANREAYRELVQAGIMFAVSGFATGSEASFRFTDSGWDAATSSSPPTPFPDDPSQLSRFVADRQNVSDAQFLHADSREPIEPASASTAKSSA